MTDLRFKILIALVPLPARPQLDQWQTQAGRVELELVLPRSPGGALEQLRVHRYDGVLLTLAAPPEAGFDEVARLRAAAPALPVIVVTEPAGEAVAQEALRRGAQHYLRVDECPSALAWRTVRTLIESERALNESENRYQRLLASTTDYVFTVMVEGGQAVSTSHGSGCFAITGYTPAEFDTDVTLWFRMVPEADQPTVLANVERLLRGEPVAPFVHRILRKDGQVRWIRNTPVAHKNAEGEVIFYDGMISDITDAERAKRALQESEERLALVIQGSSDGIWDWNVRTDQVYFSERWKSMLGYADTEIENHFAAWEHLIHPDDRAHARSQIDRYFSGESPVYELEHRLRHKDGTYRWILARGVALRDAHGKPLRMAGSHVDLTHRKQAEEELRQTVAKLARSEQTLRQTVAELTAANEKFQRTQLRLIQAAKMESVGTLAAGVAHEVKNPLQTILMGLAFVANNVPPGNDRLRPVLADMHDAVKRADNIVRELLQFSAATELNLQPEDLNAVIERALWLLQYEVQAARVEVAKELAPRLPALRLDTAKIQQVLINLFINACQAMPHGGTLTLRTRVESQAGPAPPGTVAGHPAAPGETIVVAEVQDTGAGIPADKLAKVFDTFFTTKPAGKGTGLGLSIVRRIIDLHAGTVEVRNVPGGGVLVTLRFRVEPEGTL